MKFLKSKAVIVIIMLIACTSASAQTEFADKYDKNSDIKVMSVSKEMLGLIGGAIPSMGDMDTDAMGDFVKKVDSIKLFSVTNDKTIKKVLKDVGKTVKKYGYNTVFTGKDDEVEMNVYFLNKAGKSYLVMSGNEGKELELIIMDGSFTIADLSSLLDSQDKDTEE